MKTPAKALNNKVAKRRLPQTYRYTLEPLRVAKRKFICPACNKKNKFTHYVDVTTGDKLDPSVGRCDREVECGYHKKPQEHLDGLKDHYVPDAKVKEEFIEELYEKPSVVDSKFLIDSMSDYKDNALVQFLKGIFPPENVMEKVTEYFIGTRPNWSGSTIFWQISHLNEIRTGKLMKYDQNGKRVKKPYNLINWMHSLVYTDFNLEQCLFGSHLVTEQTKKVEVVESEKTALICSIRYPKRTWLATGGIQNLQSRKFEFLEGKQINFHPDNGAFELWSEKIKLLDADKFKALNISDQMESYPEEGADLADSILNSFQK